MFFITLIFTLLYVSQSINLIEDRCVMIGSCYGKFGNTACAYSGYPKPFENVFIPDRNKSSLDFLKEMCPDFAHDDNPHLCCDLPQLEDLAVKFDIMEVIGIARCPSCAQNLRRFSCAVSCSPYQNRFLNATKTVWSGEEEILEEMLCHVSELTAYEIFGSCIGVNGIIPGTRIMDFTCGSWGAAKCTPQRWLEFIGKVPSDGGPSPLKVNYFLHVEDIVQVEGQAVQPIKVPSFKCSESPGPEFDKCRCYDCKESCSAQSLVPPIFPEQPQPFKIFNEDGPIVAATLFFIFFAIIATFILYFHKTFSCGTNSLSSLKRNDLIMAINLGSLEEVNPLRSKATLTHNQQIEDSKPSKEPLRCQRLGNWLVEKLEESFVTWSLFVSGRPGTVLSFSLIVCGILSLGLYTNFGVTTNPVDLWVSLTSEGRKDMEHFNEHFEPFYRIEHIILVPTNKNAFYHSIVFNHELKNISWGPVFQQEFLLAALDLQLQIENLTSSFGDTTVRLKDICEAPLKPLNSECAVQSVFSFFQNRLDLLQNKTRYLTHFKGCSL